MRYLIDTDWVVDYLRGRPAALQLLASLSDDEVFISLITYGEIYDGVDQSTYPQTAEAGFRRFLVDVEILPLDAAVVRRFFRIRGNLRRQGTPLDDPDLLIAATALDFGLILVTRNRRHFDRIPGLALYP